MEEIYKVLKSVYLTKLSKDDFCNASRISATLCDLITEDTADRRKFISINNSLNIFADLLSSRGGFLTMSDFAKKSRGLRR